ncbi:Transmembrane protein 53 [Aphelenchoides bicaudatus]|nr:Transmembrane protein 53 [Aphelenchoides bicaudatus]
MSGFERKTDKKPNQPVVFVLGFGGSKKKHLAKYAQLYIKQGYEVAIYVTPMLAIRKFEDLWPYAEDLYVKGDFQDEGHRPICFHIMSMVGISLFGCFWEILPKKPNGQLIKSQTTGLIFDSGPTPIAIATRASIAVSTAKYPPKSIAFSMAAFLNKVRTAKPNTKAPIVYMLGWGGAKDKQLNRYSQMYENIGCNVTRYTPPFGKLSGRSFTSYEKYALDFYDRAFIDAKSDPDRPIVFHAFSMNGASVFIKFWDLLSSYPDGEKLKSRVKGFVFDSAPSDTVPQTSAIAFSLATFPPNTGFLSSIGRFAMYLLVYCYVGIFRAFQYFKWITFDPTIWEREIAYYRILKIKDLPRNQLYLYSKVDFMIRAKDVDKFIDHQKGMGANITSKCWPDSPHIQHLRVHPDEYQKLCTDFVNEVVKDS